MKLIDPWGAELPEDYTSIIKDFGLEHFDPKLFPEANRVMRRGVVFAGRDLGRISEAIKHKKPYYVLSGIMPSGDRIHFGNKVVVENIKYFQEHGATSTYMLVADLEAASARGVTLEEARRRAIEFHIPAYIALGLDPKKTTFYFQSENQKVLHLAYEFAKKVTSAEFRAIYGTNDPGRVMAALTQAGDILFPQMDQRMPGIIPVGIDQDPHLRLTRDICHRTNEKYGFVAPSAIYHKYTPSLDGDLKMSKSKPESCVELPEPVNAVLKKVKRAKTGGRDTEDEQRKKGGIPEICMIFEMYKQHLIEDDKELDKVYKDCTKGELLCGTDKANACNRMGTFMEDFTRKLEKARNSIDKLNFIRL
ncbi:tryptophan--tRNA ligase [Candidatus Woesearchaeota archaeon]|nr:tryptophan--tRNA ligase [Candidatus Woesearchaeota archaeon]